MSTNNVYKEDAKDRIKRMAETIDFAMMGTNFSVQPLHVVPMSTKKVDEVGALWFLSNKNSAHNAHIEKGERAQLIYSNPKNLEFMTLYGHAFIRTDMAVLKDLYTKSDDAWFRGVDDPNLTAIQIKPTEGYYWDPKSNALAALFESDMTSDSGKDTDMGEEGKIVL